MNIQSMRNKLDELECFVINENCDILVLVETWLDSKEAPIYTINKYRAVHSCREGRGGGASIYVRESIRMQEMARSDKDEMVNWVCVTVGDNNLKVSAIYKPPSYSAPDFLNYFEAILGKYPKKHIIVGDFNINLLDSKANNVIYYKDLITLNNFKIINSVSDVDATRITNHSKTIIDHVLTDKNIGVCGSVNIEHNALSDHEILKFCVKENINIYKTKINHEVKFLDYKKFQHDFKQNIIDINIDTFQELITLIKTNKKNSEYTKNIKIRENNVWVNENLLNMMKERDKIYKMKRKYPNDQKLEIDFKTLKNKINNKIKTLKNQYFRNKWEQTGTNVSKQWKFINRFFKEQKTETHIDRLQVEHQGHVDNINDIVKCLNLHFAGIGKNIVEELNTEIEMMNPKPKFNDVTCDNTIFVEPTNEQEIDKIISDLKRNSAPGHDEITVLDVINLKNNLIPILTKLVNKILKDGVFPKELKISKINPIFKSGSRDNMNNYRPISVISVFSKIVEKIIKIRMSSFIHKYVMVDQYQYGFVKNSSTLSATTDFVNYISQALDNKQIVITVFVDLRKAFDVVSIEILLKKLYDMGFRGTIYNIIKSYLVDRKQYVKLNGVNIVRYLAVSMEYRRVQF